jgi:hypothetical protein
MPVNTVLLDGIVERPALRYDDQGKIEFRWTLRQTDGAFSLYIPCCASGAAAERLSGEIAEGDHLVITSGRLCYRKRQVKGAEQSRMEVLVWQVDILRKSSQAEQCAEVEGEDSHLTLASVPESMLASTRKSRRPNMSKFGAGPA